MEAQGHECVGACEIDPKAREIYLHRFPNTTWFHNDITQIKPEEMPTADCWTGGFPCQDISCAGRGTGITGSRSGLFFEITRLAGILRPPILFLENVPALLTRGFGEVLGELSQIGYDAEWEVISAADVGAHHLRKRVWIVAHSDVKQLGVNRQ